MKQSLFKRLFTFSVNAMLHSLMSAIECLTLKTYQKLSALLSMKIFDSA